MKLPSDFAGVSLLSYRSERQDKNLIAATSPACTQIRKVMRELGLSESRVLRRLTSATTAFEGISGHVERVIYLMARSRVLELEVISKQFAGLLPTGVSQQISEDMKLLKAETEPKVGSTPRP